MEIRGEDMRPLTVRDTNINLLSKREGYVAN